MTRDLLIVLACIILYATHMYVLKEQHEHVTAAAQPQSQSVIE